MNIDDVETLMKRHAAGDRDPDLLNELNRRAWSEFHDPWEEPRIIRNVVVPLRRLPLDSAPYDPDEPEKLDVATLDMFVGMHCSSYLKRKSWPFFVTYDYLADPKPECCPRVQIQSHDGRHFACGFLRNLACEDADIPKVLAFCRRWNDSRAWPEAKLVGPLVAVPIVSHSQKTISLEFEVTLAEENPSITLADFSQIMKQLLKAASVFWTKVSREIEH